MKNEEIIQQDSEKTEEVKKNENKNGNKRYLVAIIILLLVIIGLLLYNFFDKGSNLDNKNNNTTTNSTNNANNGEDSNNDVQDGYTLNLYTNDRGLFCPEKSDYNDCNKVFLTIDVESKDAKIFDSNIFDSDKKEGYVLYVDNGLKYYDIGTKKSTEISFEVQQGDVSYELVTNNSKNVVGMIYSIGNVNGYYDISQNKKMYEGKYDSLSTFGNSIGEYIHGIKKKIYIEAEDDELNKDEYILSTSTEKIIHSAGGSCDSVYVDEHNGDYIFISYGGCSSSYGYDVYNENMKIIASGEFSRAGEYSTIEILDGYIYYSNGAPYHEETGITYRKVDFKGNVLAERKLMSKGAVMFAFGDYFVYRMNNNVYVGNINKSFEEVVMVYDSEYLLKINNVESTDYSGKYMNKDGILFRDGDSVVAFFDYATQKIELIQN